MLGLYIGAFLGMLSETSMNIALPDLMDEFSTCFSDADAVWVADVYAAGEEPLENVDKHALVEGARRFGHRAVQPLDGPEALAEIVAAEARDGDLVVRHIRAAAGARSIQQRAHNSRGCLGNTGRQSSPVVRSVWQTSAGLHPVARPAA